MPAGLDHERLDVYRVSRELSREVARIARQVRRKRPDLAGQLQRATSSIALNIAEACGKPTFRRRAYFLRVARASATNAASALDHMVDIGLLDATDIRTSKALIVRIVSMLIRMLGS